ncbi:DUF4062 domain-containing protein [Pseudomonas putida]|uniref:DUF4062 domain-containing protein n=1 Tax=Pseudomonas putida TaxID=303 RepID=UPI001F5196F8|nr:DUF4062 domain-containing protein [Pseudomonas putida]EKT4481572.1 DUF4062 domain-containing protein [Pseudomonas putida]MCI0915384.1 DUF4062 domain-containing protein [Pseudomonas putida]HEN8726835.1 DUF4062 domain-containing protein [Pseudomonas putida]
MSYKAEVFNVMIASPGDVKAERAQVREVIHEWNAVHSRSRKIVLLPTGWETHSAPEMGAAPQAIINKQILDKCDLLVGVFWTRVGTATTEFASGTVEEIEKHVESGRPAMLYFSNQPAALDTVDPDQYKQLKAFKSSCQQRSLYEGYEDLTEFRNKFTRQLQIIINDNPIFRNANEDTAETSTHETKIPTLSSEAKIILKEACIDSQGSILYVRHLNGTDIQTNGKNLISTQNPREVAKWESALSELLEVGFLVKRGTKGVTHQVTNEGYTFADTLPTA